jgi:hypothetical protein
VIGRHQPPDHRQLVVIGLEQEQIRVLHPFVGQFEIHRPHLHRIGDVLDRPAGEPLIRLWIAFR